MEHINKKYNYISAFFLLFLILMYIYKYFIVYGGIDFSFHNTYVKSFLWILIIVYIYKFAPKVNSKSKEKHKDYFIIWSVFCGIVYIIIYMLAGLINEYGANPYSSDIKNVCIRIISEIFEIVGLESIRFFLVNRTYKKYNNFFYILVILFISFEEISIIQILKITDTKSFVIFLCQTFVPTIAKNAFLNFLSMYSNVLSCFIYSSFTSLFLFILPIVPGLQWLTKGVVCTLLPVFSYMSVYSAYSKLLPTYKKFREKTESLMSWFFVCIFSILLIWFSVGVFNVFPSVIVTGSMEPLIYPGDMALIEKITSSDQIKNLKTGDIIQFERDDGLLVLHRIIEVVENEGVIKYRTKGDNNSKEDATLVPPENVRGTLVTTIPKIGLPTLIYRNNDSVNVTDVVF